MTTPTYVYTWNRVKPQAPTNNAWNKEVYGSLLVLIMKAAMDLSKKAKKSLEGEVVVVTASAAVVAALQELPEFNLSPAIDMTGPFQNVGSINNFKIVRDIFAVEDYVNVAVFDFNADITVKGL